MVKVKCGGFSITSSNLTSTFLAPSRTARALLLKLLITVSDLIADLGVVEKQQRCVEGILLDRNVAQLFLHCGEILRVLLERNRQARKDCTNIERLKTLH